MARRHAMAEVTELEDGSSDVTISDATTRTLQPSQTESDLESPAPEPEPEPMSIPESVTFLRRKGRYTPDPEKQYRLKNSLLAGVGFLELANAGDFAANVWNNVPVPLFAAVLMAVGGTLALSISIFAFQDARLSWYNIILLRSERQYLLGRKAEDPDQAGRDLDSQLDVNFREMGTELVDRVGMDIVMGFGAIMVGTGTFLALGGANPAVFMASNLLSGYIGNAPVALYGTINAAWSAYVWRRAHRHGIAGAKQFKDDNVQRLLKRRIRTVKTHATLNGTAGIVAGAASLVTATMWYGYPILVLCIISAVVCNYMWRCHIGYDRPLIRQPQKVDMMSLVKELKSVTSAQQILKEAPLESLRKLVWDPESIASILDFIIKYGLFEDFCVRLLRDTALSTSLFGTLNEELTIDPQSLLATDKLFLPRFLEIAQTIVSDIGSTRFKYRERYLLEALGCYLCSSGTEITSEKC
jgi:hypothetical protein